MVADQIPETQINHANRVLDKRNYRVSGRRIREQLGFQTSLTIPDGIREIVEAFQTGLLTDYRNPQYHNFSVTPQPVITKPHTWEEHA
jgi:hypothetical protein